MGDYIALDEAKALVRDAKEVMSEIDVEEERLRLAIETGEETLENIGHISAKIAEYTTYLGNELTEGRHREQQIMNVLNNLKQLEFRLCNSSGYSSILDKPALLETTGLSKPLLKKTESATTKSDKNLKKHLTIPPAASLQVKPEIWDKFAETEILFEESFEEALSLVNEAEKIFTEKEEIPAPPQTQRQDKKREPQVS